MIEVENKVIIYEIDGQDTDDCSPPKIIVKSGGRLSSLITLNIFGVNYTIDGNDLMRAIENAKNTGR